MAGPTNSLAPKLTGVNRLIDFAVQKLNPNWFPTSGRMLVETAQGKRDPITEANFSPEELASMRQLIALKNKDSGAIGYGDYTALAQQAMAQGRMPASISPSLLSMGDPMGNVQTTLGRFRYMRDAQGNLQIVDTYDFNPPNQMQTQEARTGDYGAAGPYGLVREYAGEKIPPGYGRQVKINLGK